MKRRVMGSLMAVLMSASTILGTCPAPIFAANVASEVEVTSDATQTNAESYGLASVKEGNILHAWDWKFTDVTKSIEDIAKAGYSVVQVSPVQKCEAIGSNNDWWKSYQPYDYAFGSAYGTEDEFKEMCATAKEYGVSIIVDVIANHLASMGKSGGYALKDGVDQFWKSDENSLFHNKKMEFNKDDNGDSDREAMVLHEVGLRDVNTENAKVQERFLEYMKTLLADGASGFRFDTAKHIGTTSDSGNAKSDFWANTVGKIKQEYPDILIYGEILNDISACGIDTKYYVNDGIKVTESQQGWDFKDIFHTNTLSEKLAFSYARTKEGISNDQMITWVENHDTYLNSWGCTGVSGSDNYLSNENIVLAWSTLAAREGTQPLFYARPDSISKSGDTMTVGGALGMSTKDFTWKSDSVAAVNNFKNAMVGEKESCSVEGKVAIIKRGNKGVVASNYGNGEATVSVSGLTGLDDGTYKDANGNGDITVSGGSASLKIPGGSFVVLYDKDADPAPATTAPTPTATAADPTTPAETTEPTESDEPIASATADVATTTPATAEPTVTADATVGKTTITADKADGQEFDEETMTVLVTTKNATKATYSVDNGPEKEFSGVANVKVGEGKIANTDVTLTVKAYNGDKVAAEKTYKYKKLFNPEKAAATQTVKTSALVRLQNLFEVVEDAADTLAAGSALAISGEPTTGYFRTNPNGQTGSKKTITSAKDFTEDMIIAQGVANDNISIFKGSHEGPVYDSYAMFGAYDDSNIYIGVQYVNVIDVTDPAQNYPQSDNGLPNAGDIPQMMVFDAGTGDYTDGSTNFAKQPTVWDSHITFAGDCNVDKVFMYSAKAEVKNTAFFPVKDKKIDYDNAMSSKQGKDSGITYSYEPGYFYGNTMNGIKGNGYNGYTPDQLNSADSDWVDFLSEGHNTEHDSFMVMTVPMSLLGVDANKVANDGIGVMSISTFGASGIGCLPQDLCMLDNACNPYSFDDSTSAEKEDDDQITVGLARLGGTAVEGEKKPVVTKAPVVATPVVGEETEAPVVGEETATPVVGEETATPDAGKETVAPATNVPSSDGADKAEAEVVEPTKVPVKVGTTDKMVVNFGADKSSPQLAANTLTLKADAYNTSGVEFEFSVDGTVVKAKSGQNTYQWNGTAGQHKIKVLVESEDGKTVTVEKSFTLEGEGSGTNQATQTPDNGSGNQVATTMPGINDQTTKAPETTATPGATNQATKAPETTATPVTYAEMSVKLKFGKASPQKAGTAIDLTPVVEGGSGSYVYTITASLNDSTSSNVVADKVASTASNPAVTAWKPATAGTYTLIVSAVDTKDASLKAANTYTYTVTGATAAKKLAINKIKVNTKKVKLGKKFKVAVSKATAKMGTLRFKFLAKNGSKTKVIKKLSTKKSAVWKPTKTGTYTIVVQATDGTKKVVKKTFKIKVTK